MTDLRDHLRLMIQFAASGDIEGLRHRYDGRCPDPSQPEARDGRCPACKALKAAAKALREADKEAKR